MAVTKIQALREESSIEKLAEPLLAISGAGKDRLNLCPKWSEPSKPFRVRSTPYSVLRSGIPGGLTLDHQYPPDWVRSIKEIADWRWNRLSSPFRESLSYHCLVFMDKTLRFSPRRGASHVQ